MILAIAAATVVAFVISAVYYSVALSAWPVDASSEVPAGRPSPTQAAIELVRSAAIASLVLWLVRSAAWESLGEGALLGLALWTMPVVLLTGSVLHEGTPARVAAIHAGDWLIKLIAVGAIVGVLA